MGAVGLCRRRVLTRAQQTSAALTKMKRPIATLVYTVGKFVATLEHKYTGDGHFLQVRQEIRLQGTAGVLVPAKRHYASGSRGRHGDHMNGLRSMERYATSVAVHSSSSRSHSPQAHSARPPRTIDICALRHCLKMQDAGIPAGARDARIRRQLAHAPPKQEPRSMRRSAIHTCPKPQRLQLYLSACHKSVYAR